MILGIVIIVLGILIAIFPVLLSYIVAFLLIMCGTIILTIRQRVKNAHKYARQNAFFDFIVKY